MSQTYAIIDTLKRALKEQGLTYQQVAGHLGLSEASVKRMFAERQFSLQRLDRVCELLGMEISDLTRRLNRAARISRLSVEQEKELVSDIKLLIAAVSAINRWQYSEIQATYDFTEPELIGKLTQLDRMGLIELLPNNRIKPRIESDFSWQPNGPMQTFFENQAQGDFLTSQFNGPGELRLFTTGMLSVASNRLLQDKLTRLLQEFRHLHLEDQIRPLNERFGMSLLIAMRPWELTAFVKHRREHAKKAFPAEN